jgi:hypothetical protein
MVQREAYVAFCRSRSPALSFGNSDRLPSADPHVLGANPLPKTPRVTWRGHLARRSAGDRLRRGHLSRQRDAPAIAGEVPALAEGWSGTGGILLVQG